MKNETEIKGKIKILEGKLKENRAIADKIHRNGRLIPDYLENEHERLSARISELEWVLTVETVKLREVCHSKNCLNNEDGKCKHGDYACIARTRE